MSLFASFCVLAGCVVHTQQLVWRVSSAFWGECLWAVPLSHLWAIIFCVFHIPFAAVSLSQWDLSSLFLFLMISLSRIRRNSISFDWQGTSQSLFISWKWRPGSTLKNRPRASEATAHSSLTVSLGSRPSHSLLLCWWSWQPSTAKRHRPVRLKTTIVRLITCRYRRVKHEIAQPTLASEVVLLSPHWGRSSVWAPSPMLFSLPTAFSLCTAPPAWQKAQDEQLQKKKHLFWLTVSAMSVVEYLTLLLWSWGRSQEEESCSFTWHLGSKAARKDLGSWYTLMT